MSQAREAVDGRFGGRTSWWRALLDWWRDRPVRVWVYDHDYGTSIFLRRSDGEAEVASYNSDYPDGTPVKLRHAGWCRPSDIEIVDGMSVERFWALMRRADAKARAAFEAGGRGE